MLIENKWKFSLFVYNNYKQMEKKTLEFVSSVFKSFRAPPHFYKRIHGPAANDISICNTGNDFINNC